MQNTNFNHLPERVHFSFRFFHLLQNELKSIFLKRTETFQMKPWAGPENTSNKCSQAYEFKGVPSSGLPSPKASHISRLGCLFYSQWSITVCHVSKTQQGSSAQSTKGQESLCYSCSFVGSQELCCKETLMAHTHLADSWKVSESVSVLPLSAFQRHLEVGQLELDSAQVQGDKICNVILG